MTRLGFGQLFLVVALLLGTASHAAAAVIFVTDNQGNVWRYENVAQMGLQTSSSITGIKVRDASVLGDAYKTDQDVTMDLNTNLIYRITGAGNVVRYATMRDYLLNINSTTVATGTYVGNGKAVNGLSYYFTGTAHRFYSIIAGALNATTNPNGGDIAIYNNLSPRMLNANPNNHLTDANYTGAVLNFWDPDSTPGTTLGNGTFPSHAINAQFYQVAGNGRLEGFASLTEYDQSAFNRWEVTGLNAFGGTSSFKAIGAMAVPVALSYIPEATSALVWLGMIFSLTSIRRR
jgi:hypothetical protein